MLMPGRQNSLFALIVTVFTVSCSTIPESFESPPQGARSTAVFYSRWVDYLDRFDTVALQQGCRPTLIEPRPDVPYRGTVVLIHAYSACPQQFFELAELLALRGYRSMLVLLPGHGRIQAGTSRVRELPNGRNWRRQYDAFAEAVNGIMAYADGERILGGNSTGAAASLVIHAQAPLLYERHIAWVPFIRPAEKSSSSEAGPVSDLADEEVNTCLNGRAVGRAGYCGMAVMNSEVPALLGQEALRAISADVNPASVQFVFSAEDPVAGNGDIIAAMKGLEQAFSCMYPHGVPHLMVSQFDNPGVDMYWLDSLLNGAIEFIAEGQPYPVLPGSSAQKDGINECALLTERAD